MFQKLLLEENWKSLLDHKISRFWKFSTYYFEKLDLFPSKNHLGFLTIEQCDIELTNTKISDKSTVPLGGAQVPERESFLSLFWDFADFGAKCWVSKKFPSSKFYSSWQHASFPNQKNRFWGKFFIHHRLAGL